MLSFRFYFLSPFIIRMIFVLSLLRYCDPVEVASQTGRPGEGVVVPADCPAGYYCPLGTGVKTSFPCPAGTFSNSTLLQRISDCHPCTGGHFCSSPGNIRYCRKT